MISYKQNPAAKKVKDDTGQIKLVNKSRFERQQLVNINFETQGVPSHPVKTFVPETATEEMRSLVVALTQIFQERPMWTRRGIENRLQKVSYSMKFALPQVAYFWKRGPWRDVYTRLGYDPRTTRDGAQYQSVYFTTGKAENWPEVDPRYLMLTFDLMKVLKAQRISLMAKHCTPERGHIRSVICRIQSYYRSYKAPQREINHMYVMPYQN